MKRHENVTGYRVIWGNSACPSLIRFWFVVVMPSPIVVLSQVSRSFDSVRAVDDVSLCVESGAFVALLGPSGCGKTTLLRLIAGFDAPDTGSISLNGQKVAGGRLHIPTEERRVAMVFQSYALWPHMTVEQNVAFPLSVAGVPTSEARRMIGEVIESVGLTGLAHRQPEALSGGQRQRVALARALVQNAPIVLCDEPLANLDVHLRASMLDMFRRLHRESGRTFIYVTHDQGEALALATHVAVLDHGRLAQLASPDVVYNRPAGEAVARFVGEGRIINAILLQNGEGPVQVSLSGHLLTVHAPAGSAAGPVCVLIRPEQVMAHNEVDGGNLAQNGILAHIETATYRGAFYDISARLPDGQQLVFQHRSVLERGTAMRLVINDGWIVAEGHVAPQP